MSAYPQDTHCFGAKLRLAHIFAVRSGMKESDADWNESTKILDGLDSSAPPEKKPDLAFVRVSFAMLRLKAGDSREAEALLAKARDFQQTYPQDRRVAPLLAEFATLFDEQPARKESLLREARLAAKDPGTQQRIDDDLKRVSLLDKPLDLHFTSIQGKPVDLKECSGKVVLVVFFAEWSAPSIKVLDGVQAALKKSPQAQALGVSLDQSPEKVAAFAKAHSFAWPIFCDGQGWNSQLVRSFGINALPTVWLVDQRGILRRLNVRADWDEAIRRAGKSPS